jgi:hypothetical protein
MLTRFSKDAVIVSGDGSAVALPPPCVSCGSGADLEPGQCVLGSAPAPLVEVTFFRCRRCSGRILRATRLRRFLASNLRLVWWAMVAMILFSIFGGNLNLPPVAATVFGLYVMSVFLLWGFVAAVLPRWAPRPLYALRFGEQRVVAGLHPRVLAEVTASAAPEHCEAPMQPVAAAPVEIPSRGVRVDGGLRVDNGAVFPRLCAKCGAASGLRSERPTFSWSPFLRNEPTRNAFVTVSLCSDCRLRWRIAQFLLRSWLVILVFPIFCAELSADLNDAPLARPLAVCTLLIVPALLFAISRPIVASLWVLRVMRIEGNSVVLRGIHPSVEAALSGGDGAG